MQMRAGASLGVGREHDALDGARERQRRAAPRPPRTSPCPASGTFCIGSAGAGRDGAERDRFGELDVRRVVGRGAPGDRVLARIGEHLEFVRRAAADLARVGRDGAELEPHPR